MKEFLNWLDPHHQGPWYFKWGFWSVLLCAGAFGWLCYHWNDFWLDTFYHSNIVVWFPNYLIHEMLGHNLVGRLGFMLCSSACYDVGKWWHVAMGNGVETTVPLVLLLGALRLSGGRYLLPPLWFWLGNTLYHAGIYASDARAMKLSLTSSDMMTNFAPGEVKGDWYYILEPLGLLNYDVLIGRMFVFLGLLCLVLAVYSLYYYWTHLDDYLYNNRSSY